VLISNRYVIASVVQETLDLTFNSLCLNFIASQTPWKPIRTKLMNVRENRRGNQNLTIQ